jgi:hypothetical protein
MILLTSTSDKIQVVTSAAGQIDVHASYIDLASGTVSAGRLNSRISTATTTDIVAAPAASTTRNLKNLKVGNNHATVTNTVTVQHTDGTNVIALEQATLAPGERIGYEEGSGIRVFDSAGREKITNLGLPAGNSNLADVTANAAATYLTGGNLNIGGRIQAGSFFKWRLRASKTATGTTAPTIAVVTGPNATTGDTARVTHTSTAIQTAAIDSGMFEIDAIMRWPTPRASARFATSRPTARRSRSGRATSSAWWSRRAPAFGRSKRSSSTRATWPPESWLTTGQMPRRWSRSRGSTRTSLTSRPRGRSTRSP